MKLTYLLGKSSCPNFPVMWYRFAQPDLSSQEGQIKWSKFHPILEFHPIQVQQV